MIFSIKHIGDLEVAYLLLKKELENNRIFKSLSEIKRKATLNHNWLLSGESLFEIEIDKKELEKYKVPTLESILEDVSA